MRVTFSERKNLMWRDKLMESIFFIWELRTQKQFHHHCQLSAEMMQILQCLTLHCVLTWGESLNMGAQTIRGVEWCLAASARVCVPLTALSPPLARTVCVPMMTWKETIKYSNFLCMFWHDCFKDICGVKYLINSRHDCKYGRVCDHGCFYVSFRETCCHFMSLVGDAQKKTPIITVLKQSFIPEKPNSLELPGKKGRTLPQWHGTCACVPRLWGRPPRCESGQSS